MIMRYVALLLCLAAFFSPAFSNVEKVIFLSPKAITIPSHHHNKLKDLRIESLTPALPSLRRSLSAPFPKTSSHPGPEAWFLLENLAEGQRYEARICWAATVCGIEYFQIVFLVTFHGYCVPASLTTVFC